jgi:hypothetical protein
MSFSANRERMGVTEIGLKFDKESGLVHFGIGVTIDMRQFDGTVPDLTEMLKMCATISASSTEQLRNNQDGILSIPGEVCFGVLSITSTSWG